MNRNDLIANIAVRTGKSKKDIAIFMEAYEASIINEICNGGSVSLHGFMKIERKTKQAYQSHGFGTKETKMVQAHDYVKIRPGNSLAECVK